MKILIATTNPGKIREFRDMLGGEKFQWDDLSQHKNLEPIEETGRTFLQNACLKATAYAKKFNTHTLADDSGLEVDALGGSPGVHSARWAELPVRLASARTSSLAAPSQPGPTEPGRAGGSRARQLQDDSVSTLFLPKGNPTAPDPGHAVRNRTTPSSHAGPGRRSPDAYHCTKRIGTVEMGAIRAGFQPLLIPAPHSLRARPDSPRRAPPASTPARLRCVRRQSGRALPRWRSGEAASSPALA